MPAYDFKCQSKKCANVFEDVLPMSECTKAPPCPKCKGKSKRLFSMRRAEPTFSEQLYSNGGFYHSGIGEVVHSEKHLKQRCKELGFESRHESAHMTAKQERFLMSRRVSVRPREIKEKPKWSGRGANLPTFEGFEK